MTTDSEWERWGKIDPYFGVITHDKFRARNLTREAKIEFFESGRQHTRHVLEVCRRYFDQGFSPRKILDFGCGVGRLVVPFAEMAEHVVGLDVSEAMLEEACRNCNEYSVSNVSLFKSSADDLSSLEGRFDLIHSFIVFQHVPVERGTRIFANLLNHLEDGGVCAVQVTYSKTLFADSQGIPPVKQSVNMVSYAVKRRLRSLFKTVKRHVGSHADIGAAGQDPEMQMNPYNLNALFFLMQSAGIRDIHAEFTDHAGELGIFLYFQKPRK